MAVVGAGAGARYYGRSEELIRKSRLLAGAGLDLESQLERVRDVRGLSPDSLEANMSALGNTRAAHGLRAQVGGLFDVRRPAVLSHELLAHLLKHRYIDAIVNFNFDESLDEVIDIELERGEYHYVISERSAAGVNANPDDADYLPLYVKPHGTASSPETLRYTIDDYYDVPAGVTSKLSELFGDGPILILDVGFGLESLDFGLLLRRPSMISIVDFSHEAATASSRKWLAELLDDQLSNVDPNEHDVWIERAARLRPSTERGTPFPMAEADSDELGDDPAARGGACFVGRRLRYYWLDHRWVLDPIRPQRLQDFDQRFRDEVDLTRGVLFASRRLRERYLVESSRTTNTIDACAVSLLALVHELHDRSEKQPGAISEGHMFRSELRHLLVSLHIELSQLARPDSTLDGSYWHDRALIEIFLFVLQSDGVTTVESIAASRARRFIDQCWTDHGEHWHRLAQTLGLKSTPDNIVTFGYRTSPDPERWVPGTLERGITGRESVIDVRQPESDSAERQRLESTADRWRDSVVASGQLDVSIPDEVLAEAVAALTDGLILLPPGERLVLRRYVTDLTKVLVSEPNKVEIVSRDDRECPLLFVRPEKLSTHSALAAHTEALILEALREGSDAELRIACGSAEFLRGTGLDWLFDGAAPPTGSPTIWLITASSAVRGPGVVHRDWKRLHRQMVLLRVGGRPVRAVSFVRNRRGPTISPVVLREPEDLRALDLQFDVMWPSAVDDASASAVAQQPPSEG